MNSKRKFNSCTKYKTHSPTKYNVGFQIFQMKVNRNRYQQQAFQDIIPTNINQFCQNLYKTQNYSKKIYTTILYCPTKQTHFSVS